MQSTSGIDIVQAIRILHVSVCTVLGIYVPIYSSVIDHEYNTVDGVHPSHKET